MLILAATPIGNLSDASKRLTLALENAKYIAAEDTRTLRLLASHLGIKLQAKLFSLHEHNESERIAEMVNLALDRRSSWWSVMPECPQSQIPVTFWFERRLPPALRLFPSRDRLPFWRRSQFPAWPQTVLASKGFLPRKSGERKRVFEALLNEPRTMIFFEAPHRILDSLEDALGVFGPEKKATVSRELTKKFEHTERGTLVDLVEWAKTKPKGEMVLVIEGSTPKSFDIKDLGARALALDGQGNRSKRGRNRGGFGNRCVKECNLRASSFAQSLRYLECPSHFM